MKFNKLALSVAIAAAPVVGYSMTEVADQQLSAVTGQDGGITLAITTPATGITPTSIYVHDTDGFGIGAGTLYAGYSFGGAIVISGMSLMGGGSKTITVKIDAADNIGTNAGTPVLNVNVALPAAMTIVTGNVSVAHSNRLNHAGAWTIGTQTGTILNTMNIILGGTTLNIQLGNEVQTGSLAGTDMIDIAATVTNGLVITNFALNDANSGGAFGAANIAMYDTGATTQLTLQIDANATTAGLVIGLGQVGTVAGGMDVLITNAYLGSTTAGSVGDMQVVGLNLAGTRITASGH